MISFIPIVTLLLAVSAIATPSASSRASVKSRKCAADVNSERFAQLEAAFTRASQQLVRPSNLKQAAKSATIKVHFHVISRNNSVSGGNIQDAKITEQIKVLNDAFKPANLIFKLVNTTRTQNETTFINALPGNDYQTDMKRRLRAGGRGDLNLFTTGFVKAGERLDSLLGYASFPSDYQFEPWNDGVVISYRSLPGGEKPFHLGHTAVHEVGHWVGLYHTFQGGCGGKGDGVDDTPDSDGATIGCPARRDSCPSAGVDPIHNFMDYSDDPCTNSFTMGQITRLKAQLRTFRAVDI